MRGIVDRVMTGAGYGFVRTEDGQEFFFHRNALQGVEFEELAPSSEVVFEAKDHAQGDRPDEHPRAVNIRLAEGEVPAVDNSVLPREKTG